jgi:hypothetical protein
MTKMHGVYSVKFEKYTSISDYETGVSLKTFLDMEEEEKFDSMRWYIGRAITKIERH